MTSHPDFLPAFECALSKAMHGFGRIENMHRLSGGASQETWAFDAIVDLRAEPLILRRAPGGERAMESASAVSLNFAAVPASTPSFEKRGSSSALRIWACSTRHRGSRILR